MDSGRSTTLLGAAVGVAVGLALGIGAYTFVYAEGASYLTDNPAACANCHVMNEQFSGWMKSSHRRAAVCNDCHTPSGFIAKYATKASNGFWHSYAFTTGDFPDQIRIKPHNREIANDGCRKCHAELTLSIEGIHAGNDRILCVSCHPSVGHLE